MKKIMSMLITACMLLTFVACGSSAKDVSQNETVVHEYSVGSNENYNSEKIEVNSDKSGQEATKDRKIVKNSEIRVETKEFDKTVEFFEKRVSELGGYIENKYTTGSSIQNRDRYFERRGELTVRIPADKSEGFIDEIGNLYNITSNRSQVADITDNYYDVEAHLEQMKKKRDKYQDLLGKAETLEDILTIEDALSKCQYEIDSLTGQLERMKNRVSLATINLYVNEVIEYTELKEEPQTFLGEIGEAFKNSARKLKNTFMGIIIFIIEYLPTMILYFGMWAIFVLIIIKIVKKVQNKKQKKMQALMQQRENEIKKEN